MTPITDLTVRSADGGEQPLSDFAGRVLLIVNTASRCGFTPQYVALEALHRHYADRGFSVLAFPCNQFGQQEPGDADEIAHFCRTNYDVTFPIFAKLDVNGPTADPLFVQLKTAAPGLFGSTRIKWNFTKFLVGRSGRPIARYAPTTKPGALSAAIESLL